MLRWRQKYPILQEADVTDLEASLKDMRAAGIDEAVALPATYAKWARPHHEAAAAHHLAALNDLRGRNHGPAKERYKTFYDMHLKKLGLTGAPVTLQAKAREAKDSVSVGFVQHPADKLLTPNRK